MNALKELPHWLCCAKHRICRLDPTVAPLQRTRKISAHSWTAWALGQAAALEALGHWAQEYQRSLTQKPPMLLSWSSCRWSITHSKRQTAVLGMHACLLRPGSCLVSMRSSVSSLAGLHRMPLCAQNMGFYDRQANIVALQATGGNVSAAVDRLLQGPG